MLEQVWVVTFGDVRMAPKHDNPVSCCSSDAAADGVQHMDSLDAAYQVDFTRRLAIEFAEVDGCYRIQVGVRHVRVAAGVVVWARREGGTGK